jgi:hypothetical protein
MNVVKKIMMGSAILMFTLSAQAEFLSTDWKVAGDSKATLDTESGLEWLKFTQTKTSQYTIASMDGYTQDGQVFEGWRLPTSNEVTAYLDRLVDFSRAQTWNESNTHLYLTVNNHDPLISAAAGHLGVVKTSTWDRLSQGVFSYVNESGTQRVTAMELRDKHVFYGGSMVFGGVGSPSMTYKPANSGVFLVSDGGTTLTSINDPSINTVPSDVPVGSMFAFGLLLLAFPRRKMMKFGHFIV